MNITKDSIKLLCSINNGIVDVWGSMNRISELGYMLWDQANKEDILFWHEADEGEQYIVCIEGEYVKPKRTRLEPSYNYLEITDIKYKNKN